MQYVDADHPSRQEGNGKGKQSEYRAQPTVSGKVSHVHLQSGQEHDVVNAYLAEQLKAAVAFQDVQSVWPYDDSCQDKSDDMRNMDALQQQRSKEND